MIHPTNGVQVGQTILHYRIIGKLGEGGMGVVYKALDTKLDRIVALKFLPAGVVSSPDEIARFEQEAKAISALNHPNVATIHDINEANGTRFLVLEFIPGGTLKSKLKTQRENGKQFSIEEAINYGIQIAEGLASAHREGIIHRDVKSDNAMLTKDGNVKLTDFGLAKLQNAAQRTKRGSTVGTAAYMSPEQMRGDEVDARSDLFSLGVLLYELTTMHMPFRGEHDAALAYSIVNEEPQPITLFRQNVPDMLSAVIAKCLEKDPTKRYQTADDVAQDLRNLNRQSAGAARPVVIKRQSRLPWMIAAAMVVLAAAAFLLFLPSSVKVKDNDALETIAVLPFIDMSPNKDQEYFSDGLSEELLNVLAKYPKLRVTSRTSSFSFKGKNVDLKTIAAKLNVKHILEGSVRRSGKNLRITVQLINVESDAHLWSETYDGTMDNIFAVQETISHSVAEALKIVLLREETVTQKREPNPEAYNAYLLGKYFSAQRENSEKGIRYFQHALAIDSNYAPAWVELSVIHTDQANSGSVPVGTGYEQARREAEKALGLDPNLGSAHLQIGWIKRRYDWDWSGADECYQRALKLDAGNARVVSAAAGLARTLGRFDESVRLMRRSVELNPVSASWHFNLGLNASSAGMLDESQAAFEKCLELNPQFPNGHSALGLAILLKGKPDSALAKIMRETEPDWKLHGLALTYHALGKKKESDNALAELIKGFQNDDACQIAEIYAYRGETDKAFEWLERAYNQRDGGLASIKGNPLLQNIKKDPRYAAFLKKMKLPL
jgi:serine/threonine protein kinase/Flp pilus assembly protein TadD